MNSFLKRISIIVLPLMLLIAFSSTFYAEKNEIKKVERYWNLNATNSFSGGNGTQANPYLISSAEELAYLSNLVNDSTTNSTYRDKYYQLTNDIDLKDELMDPIGNTNAFSGNFNGNGYFIANINICNTNTYIKDDDNINIGIENTSSDNTSGLFGHTVEAKIYDFQISGNVTGEGNYTGGLIGYDASSTIYKVISLVNVKTSYEGYAYTQNSDTTFEINVGGLVGYSFGDTYISSCATYGSVEAKLDLYGESELEIALNASGIVGYMPTGKIINSYSQSDIEITATSKEINTINTNLSVIGLVNNTGTLDNDIYTTYVYVDNCYFNGDLNITKDSNFTNANLNKIGLSKYADETHIGYSYFDSTKTTEGVLYGLGLGIETFDSSSVIPYKDLADKLINRISYNDGYLMDKTDFGTYIFDSISYAFFDKDYYAPEFRVGNVATTYTQKNSWFFLNGIPGYIVYNQEKSETSYSVYRDITGDGKIDFNKDEFLFVFTDSCSLFGGGYGVTDNSITTVDKCMTTHIIIADNMQYLDNGYTIANYIVGGGYSSDVVINTNIDIKNAFVNVVEEDNNYRGIHGGSFDGNILGDVNINVTNSIYGTVYGGNICNTLESHIFGNVNIRIDNSSQIANAMLYGGNYFLNSTNNNSSINNINVEIIGGTDSLIENSKTSIYILHANTPDNFTVNNINFTSKADQTGNSPNIGKIYLIFSDEKVLDIKTINYNIINSNINTFIGASGQTPNVDVNYSFTNSTVEGNFIANSTNITGLYGTNYSVNTIDIKSSNTTFNNFIVLTKYCNANSIKVTLGDGTVVNSYTLYQMHDIENCDTTYLVNNYYLTIKDVKFSKDATSTAPIYLLNGSQLGTEYYYYDYVKNFELIIDGYNNLFAPLYIGRENRLDDTNDPLTTFSVNVKDVNVNELHYGTNITPSSTSQFKITDGYIESLYNDITDTLLQDDTTNQDSQATLNGGKIDNLYTGNMSISSSTASDIYYVKNDVLIGNIYTNNNPNTQINIFSGKIMNIMQNNKYDFEGKKSQICIYSNANIGTIDSTNKTYYGIYVNYYTIETCVDLNTQKGIEDGTGIYLIDDSTDTNITYGSIIGSSCRGTSVEGMLYIVKEEEKMYHCILNDSNLEIGVYVSSKMIKNEEQDVNSGSSVTIDKTYPYGDEISIEVSYNTNCKGIIVDAWYDDSTISLGHQLTTTSSNIYTFTPTQDTNLYYVLRYIEYEVVLNSNYYNKTNETINIKINYSESISLSDYKNSFLVDGLNILGYDLNYDSIVPSYLLNSTITKLTEKDGDVINFYAIREVIQPDFTYQVYQTEDQNDTMTNTLTNNYDYEKKLLNVGYTSNNVIYYIIKPIFSNKEEISYTYKWYKDGTSVGNSNYYRVFAPDDSGYYKLIITASYGELTETAELEIHIAISEVENPIDISDIVVSSTLTSITITPVKSYYAYSITSSKNDAVNTTEGYLTFNNLEYNNNYTIYVYNYLEDTKTLGNAQITFNVKTDSFDELLSKEEITYENNVLILDAIEDLRIMVDNLNISTDEKISIIELSSKAFALVTSTGEGKTNIYQAIDIENLSNEMRNAIDSFISNEISKLYTQILEKEIQTEDEISEIINNIINVSTSSGEVYANQNEATSMMVQSSLINILDINNTSSFTLKNSLINNLAKIATNYSEILSLIITKDSTEELTNDDLLINTYIEKIITRLDDEITKSIDNEPENLLLYLESEKTNLSNIKSLLIEITSLEINFTSLDTYIVSNLFGVLNDLENINTTTNDMIIIKNAKSAIELINSELTVNSGKTDTDKLLQDFIQEEITIMLSDLKILDYNYTEDDFISTINEHIDSVNNVGSGILLLNNKAESLISTEFNDYILESINTLIGSESIYLNKVNDINTIIKNINDAINMAVLFEKENITNGEGYLNYGINSYIETQIEIMLSNENILNVNTSKDDFEEEFNNIISAGSTNIEQVLACYNNFDLKYLPSDYLDSVNTYIENELANMLNSSNLSNENLSNLEDSLNLVITDITNINVDIEDSLLESINDNVSSIIYAVLNVEDNSYTPTEIITIIGNTKEIVDTILSLNDAFLTTDSNESEEFKKTINDYLNSQIDSIFINYNVYNDTIDKVAIKEIIDETIIKETQMIELDNTLQSISSLGSGEISILNEYIQNEISKALESQLSSEEILVIKDELNLVIENIKTIFEYENIGSEHMSSFVEDIIEELIGSSSSYDNTDINYVSKNIIKVSSLIEDMQKSIDNIIDINNDADTINRIKDYQEEKIDLILYKYKNDLLNQDITDTLIEQIIAEIDVVTSTTQNIIYSLYSNDSIKEIDTSTLLNYIDTKTSLILDNTDIMNLDLTNQLKENLNLTIEMVKGLDELVKTSEIDSTINFATSAINSILQDSTLNELEVNDKIYYAQNTLQTVMTIEDKKSSVNNVLESTNELVNNYVDLKTETIYNYVYQNLKDEVVSLEEINEMVNFVNDVIETTETIDGLINEFKLDSSKLPSQIAENTYIEDYIQMKIQELMNNYDFKLPEGMTMEQFVEFVTSVLEGVVETLQSVHECDGESFIEVIDEIITKITAVVYQDYDKEAMDAEFMEAAKKAIVTHVQNICLNALDEAYTKAENSNYSKNELKIIKETYEVQRNVIADYDSFLEIYDKAYLTASLNGQEGQIDTALIYKIIQEEYVEPILDIEVEDTLSNTELVVIGAFSGSFVLIMIMIYVISIIKKKKNNCNA